MNTFLLSAENIVHSCNLEEKTHEKTDHHLRDFARLRHGLLAAATRCDSARHAGRACAESRGCTAWADSARRNTIGFPGRPGVRFKRTSLGDGPAGWPDACRGYRI